MAAATLDHGRNRQPASDRTLTTSVGLRHNTIELCPSPGRLDNVVAHSWRCHVEAVLDV